MYRFEKHCEDGTHKVGAFLTKEEAKKWFLNKHKIFDEANGGDFIDQWGSRWVIVKAWGPDADALAEISETLWKFKFPDIQEIRHCEQDLDMLDYYTRKWVKNIKKEKYLVALQELVDGGHFNIQDKDTKEYLISEGIVADD